MHPLTLFALATVLSSRQSRYRLALYVLFLEENFLLYDSGQSSGRDRIVIVGKESNVQGAGRNGSPVQHLFLDGTFRITPNIYKDGQVDRYSLQFLASLVIKFLGEIYFPLRRGQKWFDYIDFVDYDYAPA